MDQIQNALKIITERMSLKTSKLNQEQEIQQF